MKRVTRSLLLLACGLSALGVHGDVSMGNDQGLAIGEGLMEEMLREADKMFSRMNEMNRMRHEKHHHHHDDADEQDHHGRTVKVVARLPTSASADEVLQTLQEMEQVASAVFSDEDLWEKMFKSDHGLMRVQTQNQLKGKDGPLSGACHGDVSCFCSHVASKEELSGNPSAELISRLAGCLTGHAEHLNAHCLASLEKFTIMKKCGDDMQQHCPDVQPGYGRVHQCLLQHFSDLSSTCKSYFWGRKEDAKRIIEEEGNHIVVESKPKMIATNNVHNTNNPVHNMSAGHVILLAISGTVALGAILALINFFCTSFTSLVCPSRKKRPMNGDEKNPIEMDQMGYQPMLL